MRMRNVPLKAFVKESPTKFVGPTGKWSPKGTKGNVGSKIAKAVSAKSLMDIVPLGKAVKGIKAGYKFFTGG